MCLEFPVSTIPSVLVFHRSFTISAQLPFILLCFHLFIEVVRFRNMLTFALVTSPRKPNHCNHRLTLS